MEVLMMVGLEFLSLDVLPYTYKSIIWPYLNTVDKYGYVNNYPNSYLDMSHKLQKRVCRAVGPSFAASIEPLVHHGNVAIPVLFYR